MKKHCSFNLMLVAAIATVTASLFQPLQLATAFVFSRPVSKRVGILLNQPAQQQQRTALLASKNVGEFSVINEGEEEYHEENKEEEEEEEEYHEHEEEEDSEHGVASAEDDDNNIDGARLQYAALPLGSATVQIQVGDLALARKAWKKRRRSGSPLLIPCSILNVDRTSMLRSNLVYILYKFGSDQKDGIVLSVNDLNRRHKSHLKSSLQVRILRFVHQHTCSNGSFCLCSY